MGEDFYRETLLKIVMLLVKLRENRIYACKYGKIPPPVYVYSS